MADGRPDLEIKIGSTSNNKGTQEATKEIQKLNAETKKLSDTYKEGGGGLKGVAAVGKQIADTYSKAGGGVKGAFAVISGGAAKAAAAVGAVTAALAAAKKALVEFGQAEEGILKLQAALAQNGQLTKKVNADYQELAGTLQDLTGIADDQWVDVLRQLTQFGSTPGSIQKDVAAVKNFAGIVGDLGTAANGVGKAMQGNFEMFSRWGIYVDENASKAEKLESVYRQLAERGGGQLEASAESLTGHFRLLKNAWSDLWESFGQRIAGLGAVQFALYGLGTTLGWLAKMIGGVVPISAKMQNSLKQNAMSADDAEGALKKYADGLANIKVQATEATAALARTTEAQRALRRAQDEESDARMALELAVVDREEQQQKLSPAKAIEKRAGIRAKFGAEKHDRDQAARKAEIATAQKELDIKAGQIRALEDAAMSAETEAKELTEKAKGRHAEHQKLGQEVHYWKSQLEGYSAAPQSYVIPELGLHRNIQRGHQVDSWVRGTLEERIAKAKAAQDAAQGNYIAGDDLSAIAWKRAGLARMAVADAQKANTPAIEDLTSRISTLNTQYSSAHAIYGLNVKTDAVATGTQVLREDPKADVSVVQNAILKSSGAFKQGMENIGAMIEKGDETKIQAMRDLVNRLEGRFEGRLRIVEQQAAKARNN